MLGVILLASSSLAFSDCSNTSGIWLIYNNGQEIGNTQFYSGRGGCNSQSCIYNVIVNMYDNSWNGFTSYFGLMTCTVDSKNNANVGSICIEAKDLAKNPLGIYANCEQNYSATFIPPDKPTQINQVGFYYNSVYQNGVTMKKYE
jgi:hypothetical protein